MKPIILAASTGNSRERWEAYRRGLPMPARTGKRSRLREEEREALVERFAQMLAGMYIQEKESGTV